MNKFTPYIVSIIAALIGVGVFWFSGFTFDERNVGWGFLFFNTALIWAGITAFAFDIYKE